MVVPDTQEMVRDKDDLCHYDSISISFSIFLHDVNIVQSTSNERQNYHSRSINHRQVTPLLWHPRTSRMGWSAVDIRKGMPWQGHWLAGDISMLHEPNGNLKHNGEAQPDISSGKLVCILYTYIIYKSIHISVYIYSIYKYYQIPATVDVLIYWKSSLSLGAPPPSSFERTTWRTKCGLTIQRFPPLLGTSPAIIGFLGCLEVWLVMVTVLLRLTDRNDDDDDEEEEEEEEEEDADDDADNNADDETDNESNLSNHSLP